MDILKEFLFFTSDKLWNPYSDSIKYLHGFKQAAFHNLEWYLSIRLWEKIVTDLLWFVMYPKKGRSALTAVSATHAFSIYGFSFLQYNFFFFFFFFTISDDYENIITDSIWFLLRKQYGTIAIIETLFHVSQEFGCSNPYFLLQWCSHSSRFKFKQSVFL